jgi:hypothetical protein
MSTRIIGAAAFVMAAAGAAGAQTTTPIQLPADARHQVQVFERSLVAALNRAAGDLAKRAREVAPEIQLYFEADPRVKGAILPTGEGIVFFVEVPGIEPMASRLWDIYRRMSQPRPDPPGPLPRVSNTAPPAPPVRPGVVTPGLVDPDPSRTPVVAPMTDPEAEYSTFVHDALVDALLDNALALPIRDGQAVTLFVSNVVASTNPLDAPERNLYLHLKGADLLALRQNRITRDEARTRILESRY